eukprot:jgi/Tetstr1/435596/TSEL_024499.t1
MAGSPEVSVTERAELHAVAEQLGCALAQSPLVPPAELPGARALVARAQRLASAAAEFRADPKTTPGRGALSLPRMLEAGGSLHRVLMAVVSREDPFEAFDEDDQDIEDDVDEAQLLATVEQLARFQTCGFAGQELRVVAALAAACLATAHEAHVRQGLHALLAWAAGTKAVLDEAWERHRLMIRNERDSSDSSAIAYWGAPPVELVVECHRAEWAERVDWAELYPVPPAATRPQAWDPDDDEDGPAEADNEEEKAEESWCLSPNVAWILCRELWIVANDLVDDEMGESIVRFPAVAEPYAEIPGWTEQMGQCAARLAARLQQGIWRPLPNCAAEAVVLLAVLDDVIAKIKHRYFSHMDPEERPTNAPSSKFDYDTAPIAEALCAGDDDPDPVQDESDVRVVNIHCVRTLFRAGCNIHRINMDWVSKLYRMHLHPAEWFKPFWPERLTDHISFTPRRRADMQRQAAAVLRKSALFAEEPTADLVAAQMGDVELLRVNCCAKAAGADGGAHGGAA